MIPYNIPYRFFPTAQEGRIASRDNLLIYREIRDIEEQILVAQDQGKLDVIVNNTYMTLATSPASPAVEYYKVWKNLKQDRVLEDQMNTVIKYFTDLEYSITRRENTTTGITFEWWIKW